METQMVKTKEETTLVQSVVPVSVAAEIEADSQDQGRSISNVIARILGGHYAKRLKAKAKKAA